MWRSDLRFLILVAINIVKSVPWEWDPFELINDLTWIKFCILTSLFFFFAFISVEILSLTSPNNIGFVKVQIKSFSPSFFTCFLACLSLPQYLFWYLYPMILVWFWCFIRISKALSSFVSWVGAVLSVVPDLNITIEAAAASANAGDHELHERGEEAANVEQGTPQV